MGDSEIVGDAATRRGLRAVAYAMVRRGMRWQSRALLLGEVIRVVAGRGFNKEFVETDRMILRTR